MGVGSSRHLPDRDWGISSPSRRRALAEAAAAHSSSRRAEEARQKALDEALDEFGVGTSPAKVERP